jgi:hypothetical protein
MRQFVLTLVISLSVDYYVGSICANFVESTLEDVAVQLAQAPGLRR